VLTEQLADRRFREEFLSYLHMKQSAAQENEAEFSRRGNQHMSDLAHFWWRYYQDIERDYVERYGSDIVGAFRQLQDEGHIEIITSAATHGYLPLLGRDTSVQGQVNQGVATYRKHYGRDPSGVWLPECAYRPRYEWTPPVGDKDGKAVLRKGVEEFLAEAGLKYFIVDSHLLAGGEALGVYIDRFEALRRLWEQSQKGVLREPTERTLYRAYLASSSEDLNKATAVFARDTRTALQVWSGEHGYPGDYNYLEFHKKHFPGGLRYWRVTDARADLGSKQPYEPAQVPERVRQQAEHFVDVVRALVQEQAEKQDLPVVCAPYDAELLGHWWFEGPEWLYQVLKRLAQDDVVQPITCSAYLEQAPPAEVVRLPEGSWGQGGFHWVWLNEWTEWTWEHIYEVEGRLAELLEKAPDEPTGELKAVLEQLVRELLLLQSSDWQFLITTWSARDYAENRFTTHCDDFHALVGIAEKLLEGGELTDSDRDLLGMLGERDGVFEDIDLDDWRVVRYPI
jgi:1,4-alpha-glucan branching enzyme